MALSVKYRLLIFVIAQFLSPAIALQCFVCSSYVGESCFNSNGNDSLPIEDCGPEITSCSTEIAVRDKNICWDSSDLCSNEESSRELIVRGCSDPQTNSADDITPINDQKYRACPTSLCNDETILKKSCPTCGSNDSSDCKSEATLLPKVECPLTLDPMGCYQKINGPTNVIDSGCVSTLSKDEAKLCNGTGLCVIDVSQNDEENTTIVEQDQIGNYESSKELFSDSNDSSDETDTFYSAKSVFEDTLEQKVAIENNSKQNQIDDSQQINDSQQIEETLDDSIPSENNVHNESVESTTPNKTSSSLECDQIDIKYSDLVLSADNAVESTFIETTTEDASVSGITVPKSDPKYLSCIECVGELNSECARLNSLVNSTKECEISERHGCFTLINKKSVARGCLDDLIRTMYKSCLDGDWCQICEEKNCNSKPISSSATISLSYSNLVFVIIFIYQMYQK